jgi:hypothetical protein
MNLEQAIRALFPKGYVNYQQYRTILESGKPPEPPAEPDYTAPPSLATDLFAIAASLVVRSGAYHHVAPHMDTRFERTLHFSREYRDKLIKAGALWRGDGAKEVPPPPKMLIGLWEDLWRNRDTDIFVKLRHTADVPPWWQAALSLLIIADEAAKGLGFWARKTASAQAATIEAPLYKKQAATRSTPADEKTKTPDATDKPEKPQRHPAASTGRDTARHSFSNADWDLVSVLPKSRTPSVGCTLRSLTHNLALLPPRGLARAYWTLPGVVPAPRDEDMIDPLQQPFNMLLVPLPYVIRASAFKGRKESHEHWGWFRLEPEWAPKTELDRVPLGDIGLDRFWHFLHSLIKDAERDVGRVDAVVLPESALGWSTYRALAARLNVHTQVELFVSGLFDMVRSNGTADQLRNGNFAAMAQYAATKDGRRSYTLSVREKHHRWKIERSQIESYALGSALDSNVHWWEEIAIESRSIDIFTIRGSATITTLICEDLARHDPCQELIRAIGPNLVIALLMDGAQLPQRWPGRYATVLADDPGSSVLTFTNLGLIQRSNDAGVLTKNRKIGLWRDDGGGVQELTLPENAHALCISLQPKQVQEFSLDGRSDEGGAQSWRLAAIRPVKGAGEGLDDILDGRWPD